MIISIYIIIYIYACNHHGGIQKRRYKIDMQQKRAMYSNGIELNLLAIKLGCLEIHYKWRFSSLGALSNMLGACSSDY